MGALEYGILALYLIFVLGIGWALRRRMKTGTEFLSAQEMIGMTVSHCYWLGAITATAFGLGMLAWSWLRPTR